MNYKFYKMYSNTATEVANLLREQEEKIFEGLCLQTPDKDSMQRVKEILDLREIRAKDRKDVIKMIIIECRSLSSRYSHTR